ncbi:MAG: virulence RhuM family protein [Elusimicrobiota bacterium]|jgi:hypothetical protein|nr:virulence RhuM family protein [Elusimicrobiota bacterium]
MAEENKKITIRNSTAEFLIFAYQSHGDGVEVRVQDSTIWLSQKNMGLLFETSTDNVGLHLKNIFKESELNENSVTEDFSATASDGKKYNIKHYNLDAIIAVGYRVNSKRATAFRQWATAVLRDYTLRGYLIDRKRMENGAFLDDDYFERLLEEIREIRLSERRFYQKITDIYATAMDYNKDAQTTKRFYAAVQNKLHWAIHGQTAAELIYNRADHKKERMGLTNWENAPDGKIQKRDVVIAKNYLTESELKSLGLIVNGYLDLAEEYAKQKIPLTMADWAKHLDLILQANGKELLQDAGKISAEIAKQRAEAEFEKFRPIQDKLFQSDFDKQMLELEQHAQNTKKFIKK